MARTKASKLTWLAAFLLIISGQDRSVEAANSQELVDRLRMGIGRSNGGSTRLQTTRANLPDAPFIQLRNGDGNEGDGASAAGDRENPKVVRLTKGQTTILQCEVLGMPSPVAYWTKNGLPITAAQNAKGSSNGRQLGNEVEMLTNLGRPTLEHAVTIAKLKLTCVTAADAGVYECNGDNGSQRVSAFTKIVVDSAETDSSADSNECQIDSAPPNIYMYTELRLEYPGNDAQLICRAAGQPRPIVRWYDSNELLIKSDQNFTILVNGDLLVKRINFGTVQPFRQFSCQASNAFGADAVIIDLLAISRS